MYEFWFNLELILRANKNFCDLRGIIVFLVTNFPFDFEMISKLPIGVHMDVFEVFMGSI